VYEVDPNTGVILSGAPILVNTTGVGPRNVTPALEGSTTNLMFNDLTTFTQGITSPYYATPNGGNQGFYFKYLYQYAGGGGVLTLANYSAKVFCTELGVSTNVGIALKKGFFRIASDLSGTGGSSWKNNSFDNEINNDTEINVFPNPIKNNISVSGLSLQQSAIIEIFDNTGRKVLSTNIHKDQAINIEYLSKGLYFYAIQANEQVYIGKLVKE
jgi:hypothetical protein